MKILELEEHYLRLLDEFREATSYIVRIAARQETTPSQVRLARDRADELKFLVRSARIQLVHSLHADGLSVVKIALRIGTTMESVQEMLAIEGESSAASGNVHRRLPR
jgi:hypothetical protein